LRQAGYWLLVQRECPLGSSGTRPSGLPAYETLISYLTEVPLRGILGQGGAANSVFVSPLLQYLDQSSS